MLKFSENSKINFQSTLHHQKKSLLTFKTIFFLFFKVLEDLETYLKKAIPDTKLTIKKYADVKFEYLSFCLKVKEMDDEEVSYASIGEPLYRVEAGNIEYR